MFVSRVKEFRLKRGFSQMELARKSRITQTQVSNIERNLTSTTLSTIVKISKALDICPRILFYFKCTDFESCTSQEKSILNCQSTDKY